MEEKKPGILHSIIGGLLFTLILVIIVPVICEHYISIFVEDLVGDTEILMISSRALISLIMWIVIIGFMFLLGGGKILKKYGIFGILGLVIAYWWLGDITDAIIPIVMLVIVSGIMFLIKGRKEKKKNK